MLRLTASDSRYDRRDFLRIGGLGVGGLSLPGLWASQAAAGPGTPNINTRCRAII